MKLLVKDVIPVCRLTSRLCCILQKINKKLENQISIYGKEIFHARHGVHTSSGPTQPLVQAPTEAIRPGVKWPPFYAKHTPPPRAGSYENTSTRTRVTACCSANPSLLPNPTNSPHVLLSKLFSDHFPSTWPNKNFNNHTIKTNNYNFPCF